MGWPDLGFFVAIVAIAVLLSRLMVYWEELDAARKKDSREHARDQEEHQGGDSGPPDNSEGG